MTKEKILKVMSQKEFEGEDIIMVVDGETYFIKDYEFLNDEMIRVVGWCNGDFVIEVFGLNEIERVDVI